MLNKQISLFSITTTAFLNEKEKEINKKLIEIKKELRENIELEDEDKKELRKKIKELKTELKQSFAEQLKYNDSNEKKVIRELDKSYVGYVDKNEETKVNLNNVVNIFECEISRAMGIKTNELTEKLFIINVYYYELGQDIVENGFVHNGEKYIYLYSSAGQIRTKKIVCIEQKAFEEIKYRIMCGIDIDFINGKNGMNTNKFLAYLALCGSATSEWSEIFGKPFDIDRAIVVEDFETAVGGVADYIDYQTYEITKGKQDVFKIPHTDGCGIIDSEYCDKNFMIRMSFVKGLLASFDFRKFCRQHNVSKVRDIYGKEYDIFEDDIRIILTKSQTKLWNFYSSWDDYKEKFKKYGCTANICNLEEDRVKNSRINYQMLQTLYNMTDDEVVEICQKSNNKVERISDSLENMLEIFGVGRNKTIGETSYFSRALKLYPELMNDIANKNTLRELKQSLVKEYKAGKLEIQSKYLFVVPDLYAFCEHLFLGIEKPLGLLEDGEVFCKPFKNTDELDCLRAPHLYIEHPVKQNVYNKKYRNERLDDWFKTQAIYTSSHDLISRVLQFDM